MVVRWWAYILLGVIVLGFLLPLAWTLETSLKTHVDAWAMPPQWTFTPHLDNYSIVLFKKHFIKYFGNSLIVALASTALSLAIGTLAAYGIEKFPIRGKEMVFFGFFWAYMVPAIVIALPLYLLAVQFRLLDTYIILVLAHSTFNTAFTTWMMRGFLKEVPKEIEEAAFVDGCTHWGSFWRIALPLASPGLVVTAIFCMIYSWNDFPFALVLSGFHTKTLPVAIGTLETPWGTYWGQIAAAAFVAILPLFVFAFIVQKWLVRGLSFGALK